MFKNKTRGVIKCHFFGFILGEFLCKIFELRFLPFAISIYKMGVQVCYFERFNSV